MNLQNGAIVSWLSSTSAKERQRSRRKIPCHNHYYHLFPTVPLLSARWSDWRANARKGEYLRGSCPLCGEGKSPRARNFVVHISRKLFKCFGCDEGGDVLVLWSKYHKIEENEAANELQNRLKAQ